MGIQLKRSLSKDINPDYVLLQGQIGIEMPKSKNTTDAPFSFKIGDGDSPWSDLPYATTSPQAITIDTLPSVRDEMVYTGSVQTPVWSNYDPTQLTLGGQFSATDAGKYTASFTLKGGYTWEDGTTSVKWVEWEIKRAVIQVPSQANSLTYNGGSQSVTWLNYQPDKMTISDTSVTSATNAGQYTVNFSPTSNYCWPDNSTETKGVTWSIARKSTPKCTGVSALTYTGSEQSPTYEGCITNEVTIAGQISGTNAGEYTTTITPIDNYCWPDNTTTSQTVKWTISRKSIPLPSQSNTLTYSGSVQSPTWSNYSASQLTISGTQSGTNAGNYSVTFTPTSNYMISGHGTDGVAVTWTIGRWAIPSLPYQSSVPTYSASVSSYSCELSLATTSGEPSGTKYTLSGTTTATTAGTFTVTVTPTANFKWWDDTTTGKSVQWKVLQAKGSISLSVTSMMLLESVKTKTAKITATGDGTISASSSNTSVATASVSGTTLTVTGKGKGTCTITVTLAASTNYFGASATCSVQMLYPTSLDSESWSTIQQRAKAGTAASYYAVGDTKTVTINGRIGNTTFSNVEMEAFILGINHNQAIEGNGIDFAVGYVYSWNKSSRVIGCLYDAKCDQTAGSGYFVMNTSKTNTGGWNSSYMKNTILNGSSNSVNTAIDSGLRAVIKTCTKYSDNSGDYRNGNYPTYTASQQRWFLMDKAEQNDGYKHEGSNVEEYEFYKLGNGPYFRKYDDSGEGWSFTRTPHSYDVTNSTEYGGRWKIIEEYLSNNTYYEANTSCPILPCCKVG